MLLLLVSCRKDFDTIPNSGKLEFSKTTIYLDTIFSNISSSTYQLKVYNKTNNDINIPSIGLKKGNNSKYRILVDGKTGIDTDNSGFGDGKLFNNVEILANDSLYIFIEATANIANANPTDLLYTDEILFDGGSSFEQKVNLVTLIQDAVFLYPERSPNPNGGYTYENLQIGSNPPQNIYGFFLSDNDPLNGNELIFTNAKPYVIYGYAAVPPGKVLTINAGARVHFHDASGIIVANTGSIQVNGTTSIDPKLLEKEVIFEGDRLEPNFSEIPGQWGTIYLTNGSTNNIFNNLTIKNAAVGILIEGKDATTVQIKNTQIYNTSNIGILTRNARLNGENIVINNAGQYALATTLGGSYQFKHCTFANFWKGGARQSPAVLVDNTYFDGKDIIIADMQAKFYNTIIYGSNNIELGLKKNNGALFDLNIENCLIRFNDINNVFDNNANYAPIRNATNILSNNSNPNNPQFKDVDKNNLRIGLNSAAKAKGNNLYLVPNDADGKLRTTPSNPDLGAYEHLLN